MTYRARCAGRRIEQARRRHRYFVRVVRDVQRELASNPILRERVETTVRVLRGEPEPRTIVLPFVYATTPEPPECL